MLQTQVPGVFHQQKFIKRPDEKSGQALLRCRLPREGQRTRNSFPCCSPGERAGPLSGVRVGAGRWVGPKEGLRGSAHPLGGAVCAEITRGTCFCSLFLGRGPRAF